MADIEESHTDSSRKEAKRTLSALSRPDVAPFLDTNKLVKSSAFAEIAQMAVDHSLRVGDNGPINSTLNLVRNTKFENSLATWFCQSAGLKEVEKKGKKQLVKGTDASMSSISFAKFFPAAVEARDAAYRARVLERKLSNPSLRVELKSHKSDVDMLDSKARLPGSFGSGKRR
jgi:hypothetical protein